MILSGFKFALLLFAGMFKFLPDTLHWLASDPSVRTQWLVLAQGGAVGLLVGAHTWSRTKELASQRRILAVLGDAPEERLGFWGRPKGLIVMLLLAAASAELAIFELYRLGFNRVEELAHWCSLIALSAASAAAVIHIYGHVQAFSDNAHRYGRLMSLFARAEKIFPAAKLAEDADALRTVITNLGKEALDEAGEWLRLQRSRPIEVPRV